jgi:hypothetical protein
MKVTIVIEDTYKGVYPVISWDGNGITDHMSDSLSMLLAAQVAHLIKESATKGALKVTDRSEFQ